MTTTPDSLETRADDDAITVTAHRSTPERTVFTEEGNSDGWIATDTTVELDP